MGTNQFAMDTYNLSVTFDPSNTTDPITITMPADSLLPPPPPGWPFPLHIAPGISLITFTLEPGDADAQFPSNPMQWFDESGPVFSPPWFLCHQIDNWHFSLWDFNSAPDFMRHHFRLSVYAGGTIFSSTDPLIINDPPAQPPVDGS